MAPEVTEKETKLIIVRGGVGNWVTRRQRVTGEAGGCFYLLSPSLLAAY